MRKSLLSAILVCSLLAACNQPAEKNQATTAKTENSKSDYAQLVRDNGAQFHINFSKGEFDKNGQLVTEDIYVNSNNVILVGRDNFVTRIKRYDGPFPGMHLTDRIVIVEDNVAAVHYILQGEQKGKYGDLAPTGNKVEAMSAEFFVMDENGIMKDLLTITQIDKLVAQIKGEEKIEKHQDVTLYPIDNSVPITAATKGADIQVDITSTESIDNMFKQAGPFDALVSTAGPTYVGPWKKMTDNEFRKGVEGKMMGQINLVLIGQHYINPKGSFSLITGALAHDPQLNFANASAANGAVEAFVRAAAIELDNGIRINAVSPTVIEDSPQYFPYFQGDIPVTMQQLEFGFRKAIFGANTGHVIKPY